MTKGTDTLRFSYDAAGLPMTVTHNGTVYYYATKGHPFYVKNKGWVGADKLTVGDILISYSGERIYVKSVRIELAETPVKVYNFEVEDFHTYFVGEESVLVHNKGCGFTRYSSKQLSKMVNGIFMVLTEQKMPF